MKKTEISNFLSEDFAKRIKEEQEKITKGVVDTRNMISGNKELFESELGYSLGQTLNKAETYSQDLNKSLELYNRDFVSSISGKESKGITNRDLANIGLKSEEDLAHLNGRAFEFTFQNQLGDSIGDTIGTIHNELNSTSPSNKNLNSLNESLQKDLKNFNSQNKVTNRPLQQYGPLNNTLSQVDNLRVSKGLDRAFTDVPTIEPMKVNVSSTNDLSAMQSHSLDLNEHGKYSYKASVVSNQESLGTNDFTPKSLSNRSTNTNNAVKINNVTGGITKDPSRSTQSANDFSMLDSQPINEKPPENLKPAPKVTKQLLDQKKIELPENIKPLSSFKFTKAPDNIGPIDRLALPKNTNSTISNRLSSAIDHLPNQGNIQPIDNIKNITTPVGNVVGKVVENLFEQSDNKVPENIENVSNRVNTLLVPNNRPSNDPVHGTSVNNGVSSLSDISADATNNGDYNSTVKTPVNPAKPSGNYTQKTNNSAANYTGNTTTTSQKTTPFREPVTYTDLNTESTGNSVYSQNGAAASVNKTPPATGASAGSSISNSGTPQIESDETPETFKGKLKQHWNDYKEYRADKEVDFITNKRMDQVGPGKEFESESDLRGHIKNTFMDSSSVNEAEKLLDKESMDRVRGEYPGWLETNPKQRLVSKAAINREKEPVSKEGSLLDRVLRRNVTPTDKKRTITDKLMGRGGAAEPVRDLRGSHEYITEEYDNGNPYLTDKNARFLDRKGVRMSVEQAANEAAKDEGTGLGKFSSQTGWNHSVAQARAASVGERTNAFLNSANILGGSSRESLLNSIGMLTADQKVQITKSGGLSKIFTKGGVALGGVVTAGYALQSEDVGNEMIASTAASWGIMQGWRAGRDFGSILRASHVTRVGFGAVGAASTAALGYGAIKAFSDLTSNESFIVDAAKNFASKEIFSKNQESDLALTLRQRSMQKLASSALNNRGQLLGNEAQVLKGVGIHG